VYLVRAARKQFSVLLTVALQMPERLSGQFSRRWLRKRNKGSADCKAEFIDHTGAAAISLDWKLPQLAKAQDALSQEWGKEAVLIGCGGSIPIVADFKYLLGIEMANETAISGPY